MIKDVDEDNSGEIDFQEFLLLMSNQDDMIDLEDEMLEAFKIFDNDGSGNISKEEFREILCEIGGQDDQFFGNDVDFILLEGDIDGDGTISYPEFTRLMLMK